MTTTAEKPATNGTARKAPARKGPGEHDSLAAALAAFQDEIPPVHKGKTADTGKYSYKYADLADVAAAAYPVLARHGLSFTARPQHVDGIGFVLYGVLRHTSGETDEGFLPIIGRDAQAIGSSLTYNRRYLLGCMTGIVTDEDDDGARAKAARSERPSAERYDEPANRQRGKSADETPFPAENPAGADPAVVGAYFAAADKATDTAALRTVWDQALANGSTAERNADGVTLGDYITARKAQIEKAADA
jgi:hypothetical protein